MILASDSACKDFYAVFGRPSKAVGLDVLLSEGLLYGGPWLYGRRTHGTMVQ